MTLRGTSRKQKRVPETERNIAHAARFKLTFQSCIVKNTCKASLVLVSPKCAPWLDLRDRNFEILYAICYRLLDNAFSNVN